MKFIIRDLLWLCVVTGVLLVWQRDHQTLSNQVDDLQSRLDASDARNQTLRAHMEASRKLRANVIAAEWHLYNGITKASPADEASEVLPQKVKNK